MTRKEELSPSEPTGKPPEIIRITTPEDIGAVVEKGLFQGVEFYGFDLDGTLRIPDLSFPITGLLTLKDRRKTTLLTVSAPQSAGRKIHEACLASDHQVQRYSDLFSAKFVSLNAGTLIVDSVALLRGNILPFVRTEYPINEQKALPNLIEALILLVNEKATENLIFWIASFPTAFKWGQTLAEDFKYLFYANQRGALDELQAAYDENEMALTENFSEFIEQIRRGGSLKIVIKAQNQASVRPLINSIQAILTNLDLVEINPRNNEQLIMIKSSGTDKLESIHHIVNAPYFKRKQRLPSRWCFFGNDLGDADALTGCVTGVIVDSNEEDTTNLAKYLLRNKDDGQVVILPPQLLNAFLLAIAENI